MFTGRFVDRVFQPGFMYYGVHIGMHAFVKDDLRKKVEHVARVANTCYEVLGQGS